MTVLAIKAAANGVGWPLAAYATNLGHVSPADLRGVPFDRYAAVLGNLIGESWPWSDCEVRPGDRTGVVVVDDDGPEPANADEVLGMARAITHPDTLDESLR